MFIEAIKLQVALDTFGTFCRKRCMGTRPRDAKLSRSRELGNAGATRVAGPKTPRRRRAIFQSDSPARSLRIAAVDINPNLKYR